MLWQKVWGCLTKKLVAWLLFIDFHWYVRVVFSIVCFSVLSFWWVWGLKELIRKAVPPSRCSSPQMVQIWISKTRKDRHRWIYVRTRICAKLWQNVTKNEWSKTYRPSCLCFCFVLFSFSSPRANFLILKVVQYVEILRIFTRVFSATRVTKPSQRKHFHIAISPLKSTESMSSVSLSER